MRDLLAWSALILSIVILLAYAILRVESAALDHDPFGDDEADSGRWEP